MLFLVRASRIIAVAVIMLGITILALQARRVGVVGDHYDHGWWELALLGLGTVIMGLIIWAITEPRTLQECKARRHRSLLDQTTVSDTGRYIT